MSKVYFVVNHTIPTEHPNGVRIANLGLIFKELGYDVSLIGFDNKGDRNFEYKGLNCTIFNQRSGNVFFNMVTREKENLKNLKNFLLNKEKPKYIVSGLFNSKCQRFIIQYCKKNNVKLIETVCEWFDRSAFSGISGFLKYINNRFSLYIQFPRIRNIICISTLHADYYKKKKCNTVVIPTLVDMVEYSKIEKHAETRGFLKIAYAGSPAKKDYIINAVNAIRFLSKEERQKLEFHLYGCTNESLLSLGVEEEFLSDNKGTIVCHGRIPYSDVKKKIAEADFTVLLRPNKRYANAGFPTKVGESMACGTPVIANITSDLGKYIIHGKTGIVCADESPESFSIALKYASSLDLFEREKMRKLSLEEAYSSFDYKVYCEKMKNFLVF